MYEFGQGLTINYHRHEVLQADPGLEVGLGLDPGISFFTISRKAHGRLFERSLRGAQPQSNNIALTLSSLSADLIDDCLFKPHHQLKKFT